MYRLQYILVAVTLAVLETLVTLPLVIGGTCWANYNPRTGKCDALVMMTIPQEDCCKWSGFAFTNKTMTNENVFRAILTEGGVSDCVPCSSIDAEDICEDITCDRYERCVPHDGQPRCLCRPDCSDVQLDTPVCGSNGVSYTDECVLRMTRCQTKQDIELAYHGHCRDTCENVECVSGTCILDIADKPRCLNCTAACKEQELTDGPVCGMDNNTYESMCHLRLTSCRNNEVIPKHHNGRCRGSTNCDTFLCTEGRVCAMDNEPHCSECNFRDCERFRSMQICGSDGNTYSNLCTMKREICDSRIFITRKHIGPCNYYLRPDISLSDSESFFRHYLTFFRHQQVSSTSTLNENLSSEETSNEATREKNDLEGRDEVAAQVNEEDEEDDSKETTQGTRVVNG